MKNSIKIDNVVIEQSNNGLYSVQSLWVAGGSRQAKRPHEWLDLKATKELIEEYKKTVILENQRIIEVVQGSSEFGGGTYVCEDLVYDYAMWVNRKFALHVIQAFRELSKGNIEEAARIVQVYQGHQPNHPNSLPALLNIPRSQCEPYFDALRQSDIVGRTWQPRKPQAIYHAGVNSDGLVIGKQGNTLLFDKSIIDVFPKQTLLP